MLGHKIKLEKELYARVEKFAEGTGCSSVEEFVTHILEKELSTVDKRRDDEEIKNRLKDLGYLS